MLLNPSKFAGGGGGGGGGPLRVFSRASNGPSNGFRCSRLACACFRLSLNGLAKLTSIAFRPRIYS